jgi:hypothetical protein
MSVIPSETRFKAREISLIDVDKTNNLIVKFILFLEANKSLYQGKDNDFREYIDEILESYADVGNAIAVFNIRLMSFDILMDSESGRSSKT